MPVNEPNLLPIGQVSKVTPRMRYLLRALLAGSLGLVVAFVAACGGRSGMLSSDQASGLNAQLGQVSTAVTSGQCANATNAANGFTNQVAGLSGQGVDRRLVANLRQGAAVVSQLASHQCTQSTTTSSSSTTSSSTTTTTTTTTSTPTTSSSTVSTPTTTSSASSSTATGPTSTTPPSGGGGLGGGGGNGSGGGGVGGGNGQ